MQKKNILLILAILLAININQLEAQQNLKKIIYIRGKIISSETRQSVAFAHVINLNSRMVTVSDTSGSFSMTILKGDTLRISSIGFTPYYLSLTDSVTNSDEYSVKIEILTKNYTLSEIDIYRLRWAEFEFEFLNTEVEKNETSEKLQKLVFTDILEQDLQHTKLAQSAGVLLAFDMPSWKSRSRQKVKKMEDKDKFQAIIEQKYNEEIVAKITGLEGNELQKFLDYCHLTPLYIINTSDYELITRIKSILNSYRLMH